MIPRANCCPPTSRDAAADCSRLRRSGRLVADKEAAAARCEHVEERNFQL